MAGSKSNLTGGLTPAKLIAIIVLAIVLLGVIVTQYGGSTSTPLTFRKKKSSSSAAAADEQNTDGTTGDADVSGDKLQWPVIARSELLLHDPFRLPSLMDHDSGGQATPGNDSATADAEPTQQQRREAFVESLRSRGVDLVLMTPRARIARIGELSVREGDVVEGLRVVEIHARGIVLEKELLAQEVEMEQEQEQQGEETEDTDSSGVFGWLQGQLGQMIDVVRPTASDDE